MTETKGNEEVIWHPQKEHLHPTFKHTHEMYTKQKPHTEMKTAPGYCGKQHKNPKLEDSKDIG